ncbi:MAG TPA: translation initiation factor [Balneolales bacterium]|nr:translation initiation factor [Balneolales bacterium]
MAVTVKLDDKGRRGKVVTMISGIQHNPQVIEQMAKDLKKQCGAGGTWYKKTIEIQGDHINKVKKYLAKKGIEVK